MAMVHVSALPSLNVLPSLPPVVLYVAVSNAVAQTLAADGVPPTATGQTWFATGQTWLAIVKFYEWSY
jgi:hypothetical protein